jgi:mannose-6-phosphate isomerase-like protein (cupin superfamily)
MRNMKKIRGKAAAVIRNVVETSIVRMHDVIFIPPGVRHSVCNNGVTDLTLIVVTTPVEDE